MNNTIDIIYGPSLKQVQGVNYVNNSFVMGQKYFEQNGLKLGIIQSHEETFVCEEHTRLDTIGADVGTKGYVRKKTWKTRLKKILPHDNFLVSLIHIHFLYTRPAKKTVKKYLKLGRKSRFLMFHQMDELYRFLKATEGKREDVKMVWMNHGDGVPMSMSKITYPTAFKHEWYNRRYNYPIYHYVCEHVDKIVFLSKKACDICKDVPDERKTFIWNGEDDLPEVILKHTGEVVEIVCIGSMNYRKGQDKLIESLQFMQDEVLNKIHINFIGGGVQQKELEQYVAENHLERYVQFWGVRNDVPELLKKMDLFILPSSSEGMPMVIIESMRQGLYILCTDTGGCKEILRPEYGQIISREPREMAEVITDVIMNNKITDEARRAARDFYLKNLTLKANIDNFSKMFLSL